MFNLLPQDHQSFLKKEYRRRRATLILMSLFTLCVLGIITLFPSYLLSLQKEKEISTEDLDAGSDIRSEIATLNQTVNDLKNNVSIVLENDSHKRVYSILADVIEKRSKGIVLKSLLYGTEGDDPIKVSVVGVAETRENLLSFTKELETLSMFSNVNVPVSNFAKDRDIEFSLDLIENKPK